MNWSRDRYRTLVGVRKTQSRQARGYGMVAQLLLDKIVGAVGGLYENHGSIQRSRSAKIEKAEEGCEVLFSREHRGALLGTPPAKATHFRSRVEAVLAMSNLRPMLARSVYLVALTASMVGWGWVLLAGVEWVLGV